MITDDTGQVWVALILPALASIGGIGGAFLAWRRFRAEAETKRNSLEKAQLVSNQDYHLRLTAAAQSAWGDLVEDLTARVEQQRTEIDQLAERYRRDIARVEERHRVDLRDVVERWEAAVTAVEDRHSTERAQWETDRTRLEMVISELRVELAELRREGT